MNIAVILLTSLIIFIVTRMFFIFLYWFLGKILKLKTHKMGFDLVLSFAFYAMYIQAFLGAAQGVSISNELSNADWYFVYTFIGISAMIWCYFSWDLKWKARPQFAKEKTQVLVKKIIVFTLVMLFAFYSGYTQLNENLGGKINEEDKLLITLTNITIIPGIIAFDRVLNQISIFIEKKKEQ
ncbi:MAG: hypothetical protein PUB28_08715 [Roseburia sp.]|nr:hypothetical protein [Roseburia sp.]